MDRLLLAPQGGCGAAGCCPTTTKYRKWDRKVAEGKGEQGHPALSERLGRVTCCSLSPALQGPELLSNVI